MEKFRELSKRIDWMIIREVLIKLIIILPVFGIIVAYFSNKDVITEALKLFILNSLYTTKYNMVLATGFSGSLAQLSAWLLILISLFFTVFITTFRATWQDFWIFSRRLFRAVYLSLFLIALSASLLLTGIFFTGILEPDVSIYPFFADLSSGLGTEILGALLLFLLLEVFAKTWEENEESEYADQKTETKETHTQLEALMTRWQQSQADYLSQAKRSSEKSIFNRLLSTQQMPSAYYEGQAQALDTVIKDIQNLIAEPNTLTPAIDVNEAK